MRKVSASAILCGWVVGGFLLFSCNLNPPPGKSKNLLIFCIDTLRVDHVGTYGYQRPTTPRIDSLASQGTTFLDARAHSSWTIPSTASLLTSLLPAEHGAVVPGKIKNFSRENPSSLIRTEVRTLSEILKEAGFRTGLFSGNVNVTENFTRGFDVVEGRPLEDATKITDKAMAWLAQDLDSRFFVYFQYIDLHEPVRPPEPYFSYFKVADGSKSGAQHGGWAFGRLTDEDSPDFQSFKNHRIAVYDGALKYVDSEIGRFLDFLDEKGALADTIVVITSDHGEEFWDHAGVEREIGGDPRNIWGIGHGHSLFGELLRVPLVFWGSRFPAGKTVDCPVGLIDVAPTVLNLLAVDGPLERTGRDLSSFIWGPVTDHCHQVPVIAEAIAWGPETRAVVWKEWKLIVRDDGLELLYNLRKDPAEKHDVAAKLPEIRAELRSLLTDRTSNKYEPGRQMAIDDEMAKHLKSLGYLQ